MAVPNMQPVVPMQAVSMAPIPGLAAAVPFGGAAPRGGGIGYGQPKQCWRCGSPQHKSYECPHADPNTQAHHHHHHHGGMAHHHHHHQGFVPRGGYGMPRGGFGMGAFGGDRKCYICGGPHLARECSSNDGSFRGGRGMGMGMGMGMGFRGGRGGRGMAPFACYNCGSDQHASANCDRPRQCRICNSSDGSHLSYNCPAKPQKSCRLCGSVDHLQATCPQAGMPRPPLGGPIQQQQQQQVAPDQQAQQQQ